MKYLLYFLLVASICLSCKTKAKQDAKDSTTLTAQPIDQEYQFAAKVKPIIQGVWVDRDYLSEVFKTKSPMAAQRKASYRTTLSIDTNKLKGDSLIVAAGDLHEGSEFLLKFKPGKRPSTLVFGEDELGYDKTGLTLYQTDNGKTIATKFIRALDKQPDGDLGYGMAYLINKNLVSGAYSLPDTVTVGTSSKVIFNNEGTVSGLENFKKYFIVVDFDSGPPSNLDEIEFFDAERNHLTSYSFKINGDTLDLYETSLNADSTESILGKVKYKLTRKK